jgi:hypothetical protein
MKSIALMFSIALLAGCTDATVANLSQYGDEAKVQCFSGGQVVYSGTSTGKIQASEAGVGVYFREKESGKFVRLYADCVAKTL